MLRFCSVCGSESSWIWEVFFEDFNLICELRTFEVCNLLFWNFHTWSSLIVEISNCETWGGVNELWFLSWKILFWIFEVFWWDEGGIFVLWSGIGVNFGFLDARWLSKSVKNPKNHKIFISHLNLSIFQSLFINFSFKSPKNS